MFKGVALLLKYDISNNRVRIVSDRSVGVKSWKLLNNITIYVQRNNTRNVIRRAYLPVLHSCIMPILWEFTNAIGSA